MTLLFLSVCALFKITLDIFISMSTQRGLLDIKHNLVWEFYLQILERLMQSWETLRVVPQQQRE